MSIDISDDSSLDTILTEVGGFGLFQVITYILICIPNIISATYEVNYMISANTLDYRCKVPECDFGENNRDIPYDQPWVKYAIPSTNGKPDSCTHYALKNTNITRAGLCGADMFDTTRKMQCSEYVYSSDEKNIQTEFNIHCSDSYKLALVGTVNNIGRFIFLPFTGLLSDRFGRLRVVIIGMLLSSLFGTIKSFSITYPMYLALEFLESSTGTCTFAGIYVLGIEWVNSKHRVLGGTIVSLSYAVGEMILGLVAMYVPDFRTLIRISYIPGLFVFIYFWLVPESVRWLLVTGRVNRAVNILKRIARVNRKELSEKSIETIKMRYSKNLLPKTSHTDKENDNKSQTIIQSFCTIFKSKTLSVRFFICCYQRAACLFAYFGLSLFATHIPGANRYVSFIFIVGAEIPGILITLPLMNRMKRRILLFFMLCLAAASIITTSFIPKEHSIVVLVFFLLGKASMTCAFCCQYVFTAEQWPTNLRSTIMNSSAMIGQIGPIVAPMTVILGTDYPSLPAFLFGGTAIVAAFLVYFCPETYLKKLPDTIEEAKEL